MEYAEEIHAEDCDHDEQRDYYCRVGEEGCTSYVRHAHEATGGCRGLTRALLRTLWAVVFVIHSDAIVQRQLFALSAFDYWH